MATFFPERCNSLASEEFTAKPILSGAIYFVNL